MINSMRLAIIECYSDGRGLTMLGTLHTDVLRLSYYVDLLIGCILSVLIGKQVKQTNNEEINND